MNYFIKAGNIFTNFDRNNYSFEMIEDVNNHDFCTGQMVCIEFTDFMFSDISASKPQKSSSRSIIHGV